MDSKRIGIPFSGESIGGSHMSTLLLIQGLDRAAFEPVVIVHADGPVADLLRRRSVPFVIEPFAAVEAWEGGAGRRLRASLGAIGPVKGLIRKHDLDLVHVQDHKAFQLWVFGTYLAGRPMVLHWRGPYRATVVTRLMIPFAASIVTISRFMRDKFPPGLRRRAELIYNPFDTEAPPPARAAARKALRARLGLADDAVVLAWIGNRHRRKHPEQFVAVVTRLAAARPSTAVHGILCGGPGDMSGDPALTAALATARGVIHPLGFVDPIAPTLAGCDALVVTASEEPFGRTVVEAMVSGVPVVAAADGGYVEMVEAGRTGVLVPPGDEAAFVDAIGHLLDDPEFAAGLAEQARRFALETFSVDRHVRAVSSVYRQLLGQPSAVKQWATE